MSDLIPPRRGEILSQAGVGTTRFMEYLEAAARMVNENTALVDESASTLNISTAQMAVLGRAIEQMETELQSTLGVQSQIDKLSKRLDSLELQLGVTIDLSGIKKDIEELQVLVG